MDVANFKQVDALANQLNTTDMGGPNTLINTQASVTSLRNVIDHLELANTGKFIAYDEMENP